MDPHRGHYSSREEMEMMGKKQTGKTFFKKCPVRGCRAISGFCPTDEEIKENGVYYCQNCQKETKLSKWTISDIREYNKQGRLK